MSERQSIIDNDKIKGFFEIYMDNELQGMKVDYGNVKSLYLTSVSTQTETPDESSKIKLLKQNEKLEKENLSLKLQNNRLKGYMKNKLKNKTNKNKRIKRYAKILGLDMDRLKKCKGDSSTITCRNITRELFPNVAERARTTVAQMEDTIIKAITGAYKM